MRKMMKCEDCGIEDDDSDFEPEQMPFLVQTDEHDGLRFSDYLKARKILGAK